MAATPSPHKEAPSRRTHRSNLALAQYLGAHPQPSRPCALSTNIAICLRPPPQAVLLCVPVALLTAQLARPLSRKSDFTTSRPCSQLILGASATPFGKGVLDLPLNGSPEQGQWGGGMEVDSMAFCVCACVRTL